MATISGVHGLTLNRGTVAIEISSTLTERINESIDAISSHKHAPFVRLPSTAKLGYIQSTCGLSRGLIQVPLQRSD